MPALPLFSVMSIALLLLGCPGPTKDTGGVDGDGDGYAVNEDCDDGDSSVHPGASEVCNGVDDDCDGQTDNGATDAGTWYSDADADGHGDAAAPLVACTAPAGAVADATDCDDTQPTAFPGAAEICDGLDNDCDGLADEDDPDITGIPTWYADIDGDGHGSAAGGTSVGCDAPSGYVSSGDDCNDFDAFIYPGADERCDELDNDCDGTVDEYGSLDAPTWYWDADGDGYGDPTRTVTWCDQPTGYLAEGGDCDDTDAAIHPGVAEDCDGVDEDCDGLIDDDPVDGVTWYADADADGFGSAASTVRACLLPSGYVADATDCDDTDAAFHPGADEFCDDFDSDCDGLVDEDALDPATFWLDADADGYGSTAASTAACDAPSGYVADTTDCDDTNAAIHPSAAESCDGVDEDCDGIPDDSPTDPPTWYADADGDGYGDVSFTTGACVAPSGFGSDATDCDDTSATVHPDAVELCDAIDNDCDGAVDETSPTWYADVDGDGYGTVAVAVSGCTAPTGYVSDGTDCDDTSATIHPGATETCDGMDEDCDGTPDDSPAGAPTWYRDADADGYGSTGLWVTACTVPSGYVADASDCDDATGAVHPGALETCDGVDEDCDGVADDGVTDLPTWYSDGDGDGFGNPWYSATACTAPAGYVADSSDCNDVDPTVYPDAMELCDAIDNDCDGAVDETSPTWYRDADGDGYGTLSSAVSSCTAPTGYVADATDCDDSDVAIYPGASETCDGVDEDCDGTADDGATDGTLWYADADGDGHGVLVPSYVACTRPPGFAATATDCDDGSASVYPGAAERCNGKDDDCDGVSDESAVDVTTWYRDADGDGYGIGTTSAAACTAPVGYVSSSTDCDDASATVSPGVVEVTGNGVDDDCDGIVDESSLGVCADGSATYTRIQDAVATAADGDVISLCAGSYRENVTISAKSLTLLGAGADSTTLDGYRGVALTLTDATVEISGVTLTGASSTSKDGAVIDALGSEVVLHDVYLMDTNSSSAPLIYLDASTLELDGFVMTDNTASQMITFANESYAVVRHGSITMNTLTYVMAVGSGGDLEMSNNIIHGNTTSASVIYLSAGATRSHWFYNNVVYGNAVGSSTSAPYGVNAYMSGAMVEGNIVAENTGSTGIYGEYNALVAYNDSYGHATGSRYDYLVGTYVPDPSSTSGTTYRVAFETNLDEEAWFTDPENGDFTLVEDISPCVDAGMPYPGHEDVDGSVNDMGAFGGPYGDWTPLVP